MKKILNFSDYLTFYQTLLNEMTKAELKQFIQNNQNEKLCITKSNSFKNNYQAFFDNQSPNAVYHFCNKDVSNLNCKMSNAQLNRQCEVSRSSTPQNLVFNTSNKTKIFQTEKRLKGIKRKKKTCKRLSKKTTYNIHWGVMAFFSMLRSLVKKLITLEYYLIILF